MKLLNVKNPYNAPVYYEETVSSTMDRARVLAGQDEPCGTVIATDFQEAGRGRGSRSWETERGKNLIFTILLRSGGLESAPEALSLRTGLAVSAAVAELLPSLSGAIKVKWPNDIMLGSRKIAGILVEQDAKNIYIGIGVNVAQREFPAELKSRAGSIIQAFPGLDDNVRFALLEKILLHLYNEIEKPDAEPGSWRERLTRRLYKKGETVFFAPGAADSDQLIEGTLSGLGPRGELLIIPKGEKTEHVFVTGELKVYE